MSYKLRVTAKMFQKLHRQWFDALQENLDNDEDFPTMHTWVSEHYNCKFDGAFDGAFASAFPAQSQYGCLIFRDECDAVTFKLMF